MLKDILLFELRYRTKKISTFIYFAIFLFIGFMAIHRGSLGSGILPGLTGAGIGNINANAPYAIFYLISIISNYGLLITVAFFGGAAYRDFKENTHGLYFSYPVKKIDYLAGRFTGALVSTLFVFSGIGIGAWIGTVYPLSNPETLGQINAASYLQPYLLGVLPNILFCGAAFFALALLTRKFFPAYAGMVAILILFLVGLSLKQSQGSQILSELMDPFGYLAAQNITDYWTISQKNILLLPLSGSLLMNRAIWIFLGFTILVIAYKKFNYSHFIPSKKHKLSASEELRPKDQEDFNEFVNVIQPKLIFTGINQIRQVFHIAINNFLGLVKNYYFSSILLLGVGFMFILGFRNVGLIHGSQTYPTTIQVLDTTNLSLYFIALVIILFSSGELIWRERNFKVHDLIDPLPVPEWVSFLGKLGALFFILAGMLLTVLCCGVLIQVMHNYTHFEWHLYFKELFGIRLTRYMLMGIMALCVQVLVNKKILGYIVTLLFTEDLMPALGFDHHLWRFASIPSYTYSDLNGFGPFVQPIVAYNLFWISLAVLLVFLTILFWVRGRNFTFLNRLKTAKKRMTKSLWIAGRSSLASCFIVGGYILFNTNILNEFVTRADVEKHRVGFEKKFNEYKNMPQPRITDISTRVDLFPQQRKVLSEGTMILKNKTNAAISKVFVQAPQLTVYSSQGVKINNLELDVAHSIEFTAEEYGVVIFNLINPLKVGEQVTLHYDFVLAEKGFRNHGNNTEVVENGTYLNHFNLVPVIGYSDRYELGDNTKRRKYGLIPKERMASAKNENARSNTPLSTDADWVNFEAVLSTSKDQKALTSGELLREWQEGNRRYFHYRTNHKIPKQFPVLSGKYEARKDKWQNIGIEIYYHNSHDYNIERMISSLKKSFDYYTRNFSPYQFKQIRIVEFPRYQAYAASSPTIIPYSEEIGFLTKIEEDKLDLVSRVTAHELAHQWWGKQVIGAYIKGWTLMNEVLAQYSALMVLKQDTDKEIINDYVKYEMDRYFQGRASETKKENPLAVSEYQMYLHYGKGLVVMNALQGYIGEENLNAALRKYIVRVAFQEPPYTTSFEFLSYLREVAPDSLKYLVHDMFEDILLFDNKMIKATYSKLENGNYLVNVRFEAKKFRADDLGNEEQVHLNDYIWFGVFGEAGEELYLKKHFIDGSSNEYEFIVEKEPKRAGIDPHFYLIDKNTRDNVVEVGLEK